MARFDDEIRYDLIEDAEGFWEGFLRKGRVGRWVTVGMEEVAYWVKGRVLEYCWYILSMLSDCAKVEGDVRDWRAAYSVIGWVVVELSSRNTTIKGSGEENKQGRRTLCPKIQLALVPREADSWLRHTS